MNVIDPHLKAIMKARKTSIKTGQSGTIVEKAMAENKKYFVATFSRGKGGTSIADIRAQFEQSVSGNTAQKRNVWTNRAEVERFDTEEGLTSVSEEPSEAQKGFAEILTGLKSSDALLQARSANKLSASCNTEALDALAASSGCLLAVVPLVSSPDKDVRRNAARAVANLALNVDNKVALANAGAMPPLLKMLQTDTEPNSLTCALGAVRNLVTEETNRQLCGKEGISILGGILQNAASEATCIASLVALRNLSLSEEFKSVIAHGPWFDAIVELLSSGNEQMQARAAGVLQSISQSDEVAKVLRSRNLQPIICEFLESENPTLRSHAVEIAYSLALEDDQSPMISLVRPLIAMLSMDDVFLVEAAAATLNNLSIDDNLEEPLVKAGIIPALVKLCAHPDDCVLRRITALIRNLAVPDDVRESLVNAGVVEPLMKLFTTCASDYDVLAKLCSVVSSLSGDERYEVMVAQAGAVAHVVPLLSCPDNQVKLRAISAVKNLSFNDENEVLVVKNGAIPLLCKLVESPEKEVQTSALAALSNLCTSDENEKQMVDSKVVASLELLKNTTDKDLVDGATDLLEKLAV